MPELDWYQDDTAEWTAEFPGGFYQIVYTNPDGGPEFLASHYVKRMVATDLGDGLNLDRAKVIAQTDYDAVVDTKAAFEEWFEAKEMFHENTARSMLQPVWNRLTALGLHVQDVEETMDAVWAAARNEYGD